MRVARKSMSSGWVVEETRALATILPPSGGKSRMKGGLSSCGY
jgi:hypothetical protein